MRIDFKNIDVGGKIFIEKTKILELINQEEVLSRYLGFRPNIGTEVISSPLRTDKKPSFGFFWNTIDHIPTIFFKDLAYGDSGDIFIFLKRYLNKNTIYEVFKQLDYDFNLGILPRNHNANSIILNFIPTINPNEIVRRKIDKDSYIQYRTRFFNLYDLEYWYQYGISYKTLKKFNVHSLSNFSIIKDFSINTIKSRNNQPLFIYIFNSSGTEFKIYNPYCTDRKLKFLFKGDISCVQGFEQLPEKTDLIIITKSLKDVMVLHELGFNAVAPQGEGMWMLDGQFDYLHAISNSNLILFYDNDKPGLDAANKQSAKHNLPFFTIPEEYQCKDISDFVVKYGKEEAKLLINSLI